MQTTITAIAGEELRVGDVVTIPGMFRPKWWQFWKRWPFRRRLKAYRVVSITGSTLMVDPR